MKIKTDKQIREQLINRLQNLFNDNELNERDEGTILDTLLYLNYDNEEVLRW